MAHLSGAGGGKWQRSTHLTGPGANTVNLCALFSLRMHAHTHTPCLTVMCVCVCECGAISGADPCQPGAPWEEGCSLWGVGGV